MSVFLRRGITDRRILCRAFSPLEVLRCIGFSTSVSNTTPPNLRCRERNPANSAQKVDSGPIFRKGKDEGAVLLTLGF